MIKLICWLTLILLAGVFLLNYPIRVREIYRDQRVVVFEKSSILNFIAVHSSPPIHLNIYGHSFSSVRGIAPYYLENKSIGAILFVTESPFFGVKFILAYDQTKKIVQIPAGRSGFGWSIGSKRAAGENLTDYIESADSEHIILANRGLDWKETITLNIAKKSIEP